MKLQRNSWWFRFLAVFTVCTAFMLRSSRSCCVQRSPRSLRSAFCLRSRVHAAFTRSLRSCCVLRSLRSLRSRQPAFSIHGVLAELRPLEPLRHSLFEELIKLNFGRYKHIKKMFNDFLLESTLRIFVVYDLPGVDKVFLGFSTTTNHF